LSAPLISSLALCKLEDPIWCLTPTKITDKTEKVIPEILKGLTLEDNQFIKEFNLKSRHQNILEYPENEFLINEISKSISNIRKEKNEIYLGSELSSYVDEVYETFCLNRLNDGLPIIPPTKEKVQEMLLYTDREANEEIISCISPSWTSITVEKLAINATLAGCKPEYFPIILSAYEAMSAKEFDLGSTVSTTYNGGHLIVVSGPIAKEIGIQSRVGCMGPGFRANSTIGRAISLSNMNILRSFPGEANVSTFGSPSQFTYCFAEDIESNPWKRSLKSKETYITVFKCDSPHNILNHKSATPEGILLGIADEAATLAGNNAWWPGDLFILLSPEHAKIISDGGWDENDIKLYLYDNARNPRELVDPDIAQRGITLKWSPWFKYSLNDMVPVVYHPEDIQIFVAGGPGPHSMIMKPWGLSKAVTIPIRLKNGKPAYSIKDFCSKKIKPKSSQK